MRRSDAEWAHATPVAVARASEPAAAARGLVPLPARRSTTTWPQEFDLRMRVVARQVATVVGVRDPRRRAATRPSGSSRGAGAASALLVLDGVLAVDVQVGDRIATELVGAGDLLQALASRTATTCSSALRAGARSCRRASPCSTPAFAERVRPWPQIAQALLRRAGRRAERPRRAARDRLPAAARGAPGAAAVAPRRALGQGRAGRHPPPAARSRTGCSGQLVGAERPSVSHALARLADGRARHRPRRRVAPARHARAATSRRSPSADAPRPTADRRGRRALRRALMLPMEFTPGQRRRPSGSSSTCSG